MPELPDLVHIEDVLQKAIVGKTITGARTGDPTVLRVMVAESFPALLVGRRIETVERRGHFMRFGLAGELVLVINAMLVGRYKLLPRGPDAAKSGKTKSAKKDPRSLGLALELADGRSCSTSTKNGWGRCTSPTRRTKPRSPCTARWGWT